MNILAKVAVSGLVLSVASMASAAPKAISGSTDFRVTLPEILVLYHWDDAHLIITDNTSTPANDSDPYEISDTTTRSLTSPVANSYAFTGSAVDTTKLPTGINANGLVDVKLTDAWAVRSLSSGKVKLGLAIKKDKLLSVADTTANATTVSNIGVQNAKLSSSDATVTLNSAASEAFIPSGWNAVKGDINFQLNLANANSSGEYNTLGVAGPAPSTNATQEASDTFLLTLTGNSTI